MISVPVELTAGPAPVGLPVNGSPRVKGRFASARAQA